ncbi:ABC transporter ATP-binding protein [Sulfobacillus sp. hq2]|uniref:ABC transporter domain-containing protein n=1 Tax=Sulfobacillus thermotolerans TaxID=338644 RepID=A0ABM6RQK2_9FIRM|nr:ABC transporter ATP-binding protein [Sulfobacillus sp. hq2]AUW93587.1 hypothetical protein BXT84_06225 [Sulfobacillus thermotolerans]MCY0907074.1 ABC transporter ATP-binding protein [Sulfobacillus thermotolerans]
MPAIVELQHVHLSRNNEPLLHDISWRIEPGQNWALMGANGSGKSTLLNIITGYLWPSSGDVRVMGHAFGQVDLRELRKSIGWVSISLGDWFYSHHGDNTVLQVTVTGEDASIGAPFKGMRPEQRDKALEALKAVHMVDKADRPFRVLSQGERQRVLVARAYMANFQLLILDEPCTGLDIPSREVLLQGVAQLTQRAQSSVIYVTHHVEELVAGFTHGLLLDKGRILKSGTLSTVVTNDALSTAFQVPIEVQWDHGRPWARVVGETRVG